MTKKTDYVHNATLQAPHPSVPPPPPPQVQFLHMLHENGGLVVLDGGLVVTGGSLEGDGGGLWRGDGGVRSGGQQLAGGGDTAQAVVLQRLRLCLPRPRPVARGLPS